MMFHVVIFARQVPQSLHGKLGKVLRLLIVIGPWGFVSMTSLCRPEAKESESSGTIYPRLMGFEHIHTFQTQYC